MRKRNIISSAFVLLTYLVSGQTTDNANLEKYWKYRDQLKKRFMKVGNFPGESIPASVIIPNRQYGQSDQSTGSIIQWRDATISLGYYYIVLATEYNLLSMENQNVEATLNEMYYAIEAFNRIDMTAEGYLAGNLQAVPNSFDKNGFFIRDDVHHQMALNFANDPPISNGPIQPDAGHPNQMRSDFEGWHNTDNGTMGDEYVTSEPDLSHSESLDQMTTILLGLHFVQRMVPNVFVKPTANDTGFYIRDEALAMIKRIIEYLNDTEPNSLGQFSEKEWTLLQDEDLVVHNGGSTCILASYPLTELMKALFDGEESEMIGEPGEIRWQFREGDICIDPGNDNGQGFDDSGFVAVVSNALSFTAGNALLGSVISDIPEITQALMAQGLVWSLAHCNGSTSCCEAVDGPVIIEISNETIEDIWHRIETQQVPLYPGIDDFAFLNTDGLEIKIDGLSVDLPASLPLPLTDKVIDNDNVHILLELALLGNIWGPEYVRDIGYANSMVHIPLIYDVLNNGGERLSTNNS